MLKQEDHIIRRSLAMRVSDVWRRLVMLGVVIVAAGTAGVSMASLMGSSSAGAVSVCTPAPGAYLAYCNFTGANLARANLQGANLEHAILNGANLTGANLRSVDFSYAQLAHADLNSSTLIGTSFYEADMFGASVVDANLTSAILAGTDFLGANFTGSTLTDVGISRPVPRPGLPAGTVAIRRRLPGRSHCRHRERQARPDQSGRYRPDRCQPGG